ncbi:MAG: S8 family serine peptidase [Calditrichaeota bacterium]|nr:S8 family serine peptidase [Calditrichota bacterium]
MLIRILFLISLFIFYFNVEAEEYFLKLTPQGVRQRAVLLGQSSSGTGLKKKSRPLVRQIVRANQPRFLKSWLQIKIQSDADKNYLDDLINRGLVEKAEPVGYFKVKPFTNDSLIDRQWYLQKIGIPQAWQKTQGDSSVIVAIIDTGIDYRHPDLQGCIWRNPGEAGGKAGYDDDGNGLIDDIIGWDFTDAPRFADWGDYQTPDSDPMDEFMGGHGTQIAGIIAAKSDNLIGISGIAPGLKIMNLRAGTASGYLEEDDVIRALLYALDKGAKIVNMSFGDLQASALFHDVVNYLWKNGVLLVAAAGNSGTNEVFYPAGFEETVAVGSSAKDDWLAGFSNYGYVLDLIAPGVDIVSTAPDGKYGTVSGTSFSAPMVSAVSGLILSQNPEFNNEQVRNILKSSAAHHASLKPGKQTGAGRVDAYRALQIQKGGELRIIYPAQSSAIAKDTLFITATAYHPDLKTVKLFYAPGENPDQWNEIGQWQYRFFIEDTVGKLPIKSFPDTTLSIRLTMELLDGKRIEQMRSVKIDRSPPQITKLLLEPAYQGLERIVLAFIESDDPVTLKMSFLKSGSAEAVNEIFVPDRFKSHFVKIDRDVSMGAERVLISLKNASGLTASVKKEIPLNFPDPFEFKPWQPLNPELPSGYLFPRATDLDGDGNKELIMSRYQHSGAFGPVVIYENINGNFVSQFQTVDSWIPRDAGDVNQNGKKELLLGIGKHSRLIEAPSQNTFPQTVIWEDTSFWAAALTDWDQDGKGEIVGYKDSVYQVLEWTASGSFKQIARLENPTGGGNRLGVPHVLTGDLNSDGNKELIFGDYDGDILIFTCTGNNQFRLMKTLKAKQQDATDLLLLDQNTLFVVSHGGENLNLESEMVKNFWSLESFTWDEKSSDFISESVTGFYPYYPKNKFDSGIQTFRQEDERFLFLALSPSLYLFRNAGDGWLPVWSTQNCLSNTIVVDDFDNDGSVECYFNNGESIAGFSKEQTGLRPSPPFNFRALPVDSQRIRIKWEGQAADGFRIYRGTGKNTLRPVGIAKSHTFLDSLLNVNQTYYYRVTAIDSSFGISESGWSNMDSAATGIPPRLLSVDVVDERRLILQFDQKMKTDPSRPARVRLKLRDRTARSVSVLQPADRVLAVFDEPFVNSSSDTVEAENLFSRRGIPPDKRFNSKGVFIINPDEPPHVREIRLEDRRHVRLLFSQPMDSASLTNLENYELLPSGRVEEATITDAAHQTIRLILSAESQAGGFGQPVYLKLKGIKNRKGVEIEQPVVINLYREAETLDKVVIYPQPVRPDNKRLIFAKLPQNSQIQIFNLNGKVIRSLKNMNDAGGIIWDLRDENGSRVKSGIYFYRIVHRSDKKTGKLVIVR